MGRWRLEYYKKRILLWQMANWPSQLSKKRLEAKAIHLSSDLKGKNFFTLERVDIRAVLPKDKECGRPLDVRRRNFLSKLGLSVGEIDIWKWCGSVEESRPTVHGTVHWDMQETMPLWWENPVDTGIFTDEYHVFFNRLGNKQKIVWLLWQCWISCN